VKKRALAICVFLVAISNLFYVLGKAGNRSKAIEDLRKLKHLVKILPVEKKTVELALASDLGNFVDAIQFYTAVRHRIRCWITRKVQERKTGQIVILTAEKFLKIRKVKGAIKR
jgi:hypothetical protein